MTGDPKLRTVEMGGAVYSIGENVNDAFNVYDGESGKLVGQFHLYADDGGPPRAWGTTITEPIGKVWIQIRAAAGMKP